MSFINKKNDGRRRGFNLFDQAFEAIFKFPFDAGARLQQREIERADANVLKHRRNITGSNAKCETFDYGGFSDARFAGQDRIVLTAARKNVDDLTDLVITP